MKNLWVVNGVKGFLLGFMVIVNLWGCEICLILCLCYKNIKFWDKYKCV